MSGDDVEEEDLRPEYDPSQLGGGVRGKHLARYRDGTNLALLTPEIRAAFPSDEAVNRELRSLRPARNAELPGLTGPQKEVLRLAELASEDDADPAALKTAIKRLLMMTTKDTRKSAIPEGIPPLGDIQKSQEGDKRGRSA